MKLFAHPLTLFLSSASIASSTFASTTNVRTEQHKKRSLQSSLFPASHVYASGFTTGASISIPGVSSVALSDATLNVIKVTSGLTHNVVSQGGKTAWEAIYPEGSWNPSNTPRGGFGFYLGGTDAFVSAIANGADEVMLGYSVMFQDGFQFNKGGKLPGAFGGDGDLAFGCSGGRQEDRASCFDIRLMWRTNGAGELYTYLPLTDSNNAAQLGVPGSIANSDFGYSIARGSFTFPTGQWVTIAQRVKLNTPGETNGQIKLWVNGAEVIQLYNVTLREDEDDGGSTIQGMHFQTFFGGSTSDWASPQTQKAWFADVTGAVIVS